MIHCNSQLLSAVLTRCIDNSLFSGQTVSGIDIHFDDATSGFFIKSRTEEAVGGEDQLSTNLTVLRSSELVSLRATYGPFLSRERLAPARVIGRKHVMSEHFT